MIFSIVWCVELSDPKQFSELNKTVQRKRTRKMKKSIDELQTVSSK